MGSLETRVLEFVEAESGRLVDMGTKLDDLGLESLDFLELITEFEKKFSTKIPDDKFGTLQCVRDLLRYVPA